MTPFLYFQFNEVGPMMNGVKVISFILCVAWLSMNAVAQGVSWQVVEQNSTQVLRLKIWETDYDLKPEALRVFVGVLAEWPGDDVISVSGTVSGEKNTIIFRPTFPFREEVTYTAFWNQKEGFTFSITSDTPKAELLAIYPSANVLPANLLKIYLHFSAPMGEGRAYEHLSLINAAGDTVYQPFVPLQPELWSEDHQRLTLWLDPGRVKRGLLSHETHGVVIQPEENYTLIIDPSWKDAGGRQLGKTDRKTFRVVAPDYESPKLAKWDIQTPGVGTPEPLVIDFNESLDQALTTRLLAVQSESGQTIAGKVFLKENESQWYFYPEEPWSEGNFTVRIDGALEDLAGNNLNRPFDREIVAGEKKYSPQDFFFLEFQIKASK